MTEKLVAQRAGELLTNVKSGKVPRGTQSLEKSLLHALSLTKSTSLSLAGATRLAVLSVRQQCLLYSSPPVWMDAVEWANSGPISSTSYKALERAGDKGTWWRKLVIAGTLRVYL